MGQARFYPAFLRIEGRKCIVVGGGQVAYRKVKSLHAAGARVLVVSPEFCLPLARMKGVRRLRRPYRSSDLRGAVLAISATDDPKVNQQVARDAMNAGVWVNVVDQPDLCSFIVPATLRRGHLAISVSTAGAGPALAAQVRQELGRKFGVEYERLVKALAKVRPYAQRLLADSRIRRQCLREFASPAFLKKARRLSASALFREMLRRIRLLAG